MASGNDWEEVRRLMNDFQRVQQGSTAQKLSERNCIEIVTSLMKMKLLDVIYTTDGKEYITPQHLLREIRDEIVVHGGRVNIVDVAQALNVDLSHIEHAVKDLIKSDSSLQFVLGQLINSEYVASLADDINERLQEKGVINVSDLTIVFDLPADFLLSIVGDNLGTRIHGQRDPNNNRVILTDWLIARHRAVLRGALNASCRPVAIQSLIKEHALNERLAAIVVEELISLGEVAGTLSAQSRKDKAAFIPHVYTTAQNAWIDAFLKSNANVPYDAVKKLDIGDPKQFLKNRYSALDFMFLEFCMLPRSTLARAENEIEEVSASGGWTEVANLFPSGLDDQDIAEVVRGLISSKKVKDVRLVQENYIVATKMLDECKKSFEGEIEAVSEEEAEKQASILLVSPGGGKRDEDDENESVASSRKDRKAKKQQPSSKNPPKSGKSKRGDNEDEQRAPDFLSVPAVSVKLQKVHDDAPCELLGAIAEMIQIDLLVQYRQVLDTKAKVILAASVTDRKQTFKSTQDQISANVWLMRLFCKGIGEFSSEADRKQLSKHLLRNIGTEILNPLLFFVMEDLGISAPEKTDLTSDSRGKIISKLPEPLKSNFEKCNLASNGDSVEIFEDALNVLLESSAIGMPIKKADKKRETQICQEHRQQLLTGLSQATDVATALRFCCLALFLKKTGSPLDAPGKFVTQIMAFIKRDLSAEQAAFLDICRDKVQSSGTSSDEVHDIVVKLSQIAQS